MKGMPLILAAVNPMLGPLVPVLGSVSKKIRTENLAEGDRVLVYGIEESEFRKVICELQGPGDKSYELNLTGYQYVQVERFNVGSQLHVWLEG